MGDWVRGRLGFVLGSGLGRVSVRVMVCGSGLCLRVLGYGRGQC